MRAERLWRFMSSACLTSKDKDPCEHAGLDAYVEKIRKNLEPEITARTAAARCFMKSAPEAEPQARRGRGAPAAAVRLWSRVLPARLSCACQTRKCLND